jgi:predicted MPP superfamily phosphohydrolase
MIWVKLNSPVHKSREQCTLAHGGFRLKSAQKMETSTASIGFPPSWDPEWLERRTRLERERLGSGRKRTIPMPLHYRLFGLGLRATGLFARGYRNFLDIRLNLVHHAVAGWPDSLDGYRILQISDPHIDIDPALMDPLGRILANVECELAVVTGDFQEGAHPTHKPAVDLLREILRILPSPRDGIYGVLGNHDAAALGAAIQQLGLPILVNEAVTIGTSGPAFALAGIDDPYFFRLHDIRRAAGQCPRHLPRVLLSHSPQVAPAAREAGFTFMLSGHTHGGQVCLPGGRSIVTMEDIPPPFFRGEWRLGALTGYTSTGTGACHVPVRFNCPPEVVIHILHPPG